MKARLVFAATFFALIALLSLATNSSAQNEVASVFTFGHSTGSINAGLTRYLAAFDGTAANADNFKIVIPQNGTLKNLYWAAAASTLTGTGNTITVLKNGVFTSLAATWNTPTTSGNNTINSETVVAGDVISVRIQLGTGSGNITRPTVSFEFLTASSSSSQWISSGNNIYYTAGNVGIGTTSPSEKLDVAGKIKTQNLQVTNGAAAGLVLTSDASGNASWGSNNDADANPANEIQTLSLSGNDLSISGGNTVTLPPPPDISARVLNSGNISVPHGVTTFLPFNDEHFDTANLHSTSSNTHCLTAPTNGKYLIYGHVKFASNSNGIRTVSIQRVAGDNRALANMTVNPVIGSETELTVATHIEAAAGDCFVLAVYQTSGGPLDVLLQPDTSPEFGIVKLP